MEFSKVLASHLTSTTPRYTVSKREKLLRFIKDNGIGIQEAIGWLGGRR